MPGVFLLRTSHLGSDCPLVLHFKVPRAVAIGLAICLLFPTLLLSQPKPMKWGEVPRADLEMQEFPDDTNAAAVILGDYGEVIPVYPLLRQFNAVLTYVQAGEQEYLLDATDPLRPYGMLPVAALTDVGWLVDKKTPSWVQIVNRESFNTHATVSATLAPNGAISGLLQASASGYNALAERRALQDQKEDEYIREVWLKSLAGAKLDSFRIGNKDSIHAPLTIQAFFSVSENTQATPVWVAGDKIYLNPILWGRREENPFMQPERLSRWILVMPLSRATH